MVELGMKKAIKTICPFELSFHGFASQKEKKEVQSKQHTMHLNVKLKGKFIKENPGQQKESYPWNSVVSELVELQNTRVGQTWKEGEKKERLAGERETGEQREGEPHHFLYYPVHLPSFS